MTKYTVCVDFDGVLNDYHGYDENDLSTPQIGAKEFITKLQLKYEVVIHTTRDSKKVKDWLKQYEFPPLKVTNIKQPAVAYIDDRAIRYNSNFNEVLDKLQTFKTHWEKVEEIEEGMTRIIDLEEWDKIYKDMLRRLTYSIDKSKEDFSNEVNSDWYNHHLTENLSVLYAEREWLNSLNEEIREKSKKTPKELRL